MKKKKNQSDRAIEKSESVMAKPFEDTPEEKRTVLRSRAKSRNPQTGAAIKIAAKKVPVFKAGKGLKDAVK